MNDPDTSTESLAATPQSEPAAQGDAPVDVAAIDAASPVEATDPEPADPEPADAELTPAQPTAPEPVPHAGARYALLRLLMLVAVAGILYVLGMRGWLLAFAAVLVSGVLEPVPAHEAAQRRGREPGALAREPEAPTRPRGRRADSGVSRPAASADHTPEYECSPLANRLTPKKLIRKHAKPIRPSTAALRPRHPAVARACR